MSDYQRIAKAIEYIVANVEAQPKLETVAEHVCMSAYHFQRLFSRWAGVSPKRFLQVLTLERAKILLSQSQSVLGTSHSVGLSSASRLYDHFVQIEAMTPGEYKNGGQQLVLDYGQHQTPFGVAFIAISKRGICQFGFVDEQNCLDEVHRQWPNAKIVANEKTTKVAMQDLFSQTREKLGPLSLHVRGTNFQVKVWQALLRIPPGRIVSYGQVAEHLQLPRAARAVGTAIGRNPIAFLIPCHRVIRQTGHLGGYHWGETRMHAIHAWESARLDPE